MQRSAEYAQACLPFALPCHISSIGSMCGPCQRTPRNSWHCCGTYGDMLCFIQCWIMRGHPPGVTVMRTVALLLLA
jgi:hypothetical protein